MLAAVAAGAVDQAVLLTGAGVGCIALLTPPEEALHMRGGTNTTPQMNHRGREKCSGTGGSDHVFVVFVVLTKLITD